MLWVAIFVSNAAVLILEIVGARALIPFFGSSTETWTGIITTVILGLALGYWWGGVAADRFYEKAQELAALALATAGLLTLALWSGSDAIGALGAALTPYIGPVFGTVVTAVPLLFLPSIFLAAVSPLIAKVLLSSLATSARTVGRISAVAAVGSVAGSLGVALILVPYLGSRIILLGTGAVLILLGVLLVRGKARIAVIACAIAGAVACTANVVFATTLSDLTAESVVADVDSRYGRIIVSDTVRGGVTLRSVRTGPFGVQCGAQIVDEVQADTLPFPYLRVFDYVSALAPSTARVLVLGGCNYSYPRHVAKSWGSSHVDVVEIDPAMTEIAKKYFGFVPSESVRPIHEDARGYLFRSAETYDVIIMDAFGVPLTVPFELLTKEAFSLVRDRLSADGVVGINIIGSVTGPGGTYTASVVKTIQSVFPEVGVYQIGVHSTDAIQNLFIIASRTVPVPGTPTRVYPHQEVLYPVDLSLLPAEGTLVLTDDYAPTESLARPMREAVFQMRR